LNLDFKLCDTEGDHFLELKQEIIHRRSDSSDDQVLLRPVMVFFDCRETLLHFYNHVLMDSLRGKTEIVTEATLTAQKESLFVGATEKGAITLLVRDFGRGTDFKCYDTRVLSAGGVHVIQAFFSDALSEEIQIKGRCARQGAGGSYRCVPGLILRVFLSAPTSRDCCHSMVLNVEDLRRRFQLSQDDVEGMRSRRELYSFLAARRSELHSSNLEQRVEAVAMSMDMHYRTIACKELLENGFRSDRERQQVVDFVLELNGVRDSDAFKSSGTRRNLIERMQLQYDAFKKEDLARRRKAREALLIAASEADQRRMEEAREALLIEASDADQLRTGIRERLKIENLTHYALLGLERGASASDIKDAYRKLSLVFHPDRCSDEDATSISQKLNEAHEVLTCDEKRAQYDAQSP
jgi:hypothetical protein